MNRTLLALTAVALLLAPAAYASEITGTLTAGASSSATIMAPTASPAAGTYGSALSVTLTDPGTYAIRYTLDGTAPDCFGGNGTLYGSPISISSNTTIMAIGCYLSGASSPVASFVYTINGGSLTGTVATSSSGSLTGTVVSNPSGGTLTGTVVPPGGGCGGGCGGGSNPPPGNGPPPCNCGGGGGYPPVGGGLGWVCPIQGNSYNSFLGNLPCLFTLGSLFGGGNGGGVGVPNTGGTTPTPTTNNGGTSAQNPGIPNTGAGGDAAENMILLTTSALVAGAGILALRKRYLA